MKTVFSDIKEDVIEAAKNKKSLEEVGTTFLSEKQEDS